MVKILIATSSFAKDDPGLLERCKQGGELVMNPFGRKLTSDEFLRLAGDVTGVIAGTEEINEKILAQLPKLKVISRCGVGLENVDLKTCEELGIKVYNTPSAPTLAVAELTVGLVLAMLRKISVMDRGIRSGNWEKCMGNLLSGKNVGIIGFGRIGKKVFELLRPFGAVCCYYDVKQDDAVKDCTFLPIEKMLPWADIISLHCSVARGSNPVIGKNELARMKKGAWLVNVSRGDAIDEGALYESLKHQHLAGAALDVFKKEPYNGPLKDIDTVVLTPHIGSYSKEARIEMERQSVENLLEGLGGLR